ncbi:MAG: hypothetical protein O3B72_06800, partial [Proteobacteria bacterium]|nr:hypothetical protein [Pseudomonadota bacterium]
MARLFTKFFITLGLVVSFASSAHLGGVPVGAVEASLVQVQHNAYLMTAPSASTGNVSTLHIINTSNQSQQFYGTLYDQDGNRIGEEQTLLTSSSVAPYARVKLTSEAISDIFGGTWNNPAMLEVYGTDSFSLMIRLSSPSGLVSNTNCVTEDVVHNLDGFDATDLPFVRFINTGSTTLTDITGTLYNESGTVVGSPDQVLVASLAPKAQTFVNRNALAAAFGEQWDGVGSLYIADRAGLKLILMSYIVDSATFFNFSCFDGNDDLDNPVNDQGGPLTEAVDITNVIFTETSADCATYAEAYRATANDVFNSTAFTAVVTVTDGGSSCTLTSNAIPNHDFNDTAQGFANQPAEVERSFSLPRNPGIAFVPPEISQA